MSRKSLIQRTEVDFAGQAHNCQASAKHRLSKGEVRLKVHVKRSFDHYCLQCALAIIDRDLSKLQLLRQQLMAGETSAKT